VRRASAATSSARETSVSTAASRRRRPRARARPRRARLDVGKPQAFLRRSRRQRQPIRLRPRHDRHRPRFLHAASSFAKTQQQAGRYAARDLNAVGDLLAFLDRSPTPYHAVAESVRRLEAGGWREAQEVDLGLAPGEKRYSVRGGGSLVALRMGAVSPVQGGFRVLGAHTDSPNLRLKPRADVAAQGYQQLAVEPYGGVLAHTWLDRDLSLAGQVTLRDENRTRTPRRLRAAFAARPEPRVLNREIPPTTSS
jgi:hypothetical protein